MISIELISDQFGIDMIKFLTNDIPYIVLFVRLLHHCRFITEFKTKYSKQSHFDITFFHLSIQKLGHFKIFSFVMRKHNRTPLRKQKPYLPGFFLIPNVLFL